MFTHPFFKFQKRFTQFLTACTQLDRIDSIACFAPSKLKAQKVKTFTVTLSKSGKQLFKALLWRYVQPKLPETLLHFFEIADRFSDVFSKLYSPPNRCFLSDFAFVVIALSEVGNSLSGLFSPEYCFL